MWTLETASGHRMRIPEQGLRIGRNPDCDLVLENRHASGLHAMLVPTARGLELFSLGRNPTQVNSKPVEGRAKLISDDEVQLPGLCFRVRGSSSPGISWLLEHGEIRRRIDGTLRIGGSDSDDLIVEAWPARAVVVTLVHNQPVAEIRQGMSLHSELQEPTIQELVDGDELSCGPGLVRVRAVMDDAAPTLRAAVLPVRAHFSFLPTGGLLQLGFADGTSAEIELPELRARLVAALLSPPGDYEGGELVPDELLLSAIWPGANNRDRTDLNTLVHRTRKELLRAGVNPTNILVRARGGGATRFRVIEGAQVAVI